MIHITDIKKGQKVDQETLDKQNCMIIQFDDEADRKAFIGLFSTGSSMIDGLFCKDCAALENAKQDSNQEKKKDLTFMIATLKRKR